MRRKYLVMTRILVVLFVFMLWISYTLGGHDAKEGYIISCVAAVFMTLVVVGHALTAKPMNEEQPQRTRITREGVE